MTSAAIDTAHDDRSGWASGAGEFVSTYVFSKDHKIIGLQFLFSTLLLLFWAPWLYWTLASPLPSLSLYQ